jgi:hypothetical protein
MQQSSGCSFYHHQSDTEEMISTPPMSQELPQPLLQRSARTKREQQGCKLRKPNLLRLVKTIVKKQPQTKDKRILWAQRTQKMFTGFFPDAVDVCQVQLAMRVATEDDVEEVEEEEGEGKFEEEEHDERASLDAFHEHFISHIVENDIDTANFQLFLKWPDAAQRAFHDFLSAAIPRISLVRFAYHHADWVDKETCNFTKWSCEALERVGSVGELMDRVAVSG